MSWRALLPAVAVAAAVTSATPAAAEYACDTVDTSRTEATACVTVLDDSIVACVYVDLDPSKQTLDEESGGSVCLLDFGAGPQVYTCFHVGRQHFLCAR